MAHTSAGRVILVTGASSGFGKLAVSRLLARGHAVIAGLRGGDDRLRSLFLRELSLYPGKLCALDLHMDRPADFPAAREFLEREFDGRLDVLVNNAGFGLMGPVEDQTAQQIRYQFEVNVFGPMLLTRELLPLLRKARGRVLNVSSIGGRAVLPFYGTYNSTKHALEGHSEGLYYEVKRFGVQVGLIEPGTFKTEFSAQSMIVGEGSKHSSSHYFRQMERFQAFLLRHQAAFPNPERVARKLVQLCEVRRVPIRTVVGADARMLLLARWILPEHWRVALTEWIFRSFVARP